MRSSLFWKLMAGFTIVILVGIGGALVMAGKMKTLKSGMGSRPLSWA